MRRRSGHGQSSRHEQEDAILGTRAFEPSRPAHPSPLAASTIRGIPLDIVDRIRSFSFFSSAPDEFLVAIGACLRLQVYSPQESILNEGDEAKAMYWLIRGTVMVTSRDRESVYAELPPGSFFGEIGIMMDVPRTASIVARYKSLVARLNKEDLQKELPKYPLVERAIREEAAERLAILQRKKMSLQKSHVLSEEVPQVPRRSSKRPHEDLTDSASDSADMDDGRITMQARRGSSKKLKSPGPSIVETAVTSALSSGSIHIRGLLKQLPLFSKLPDEFLHFLGLNAEAQTFPPFTLILKQGSQGRDVFFMAGGVVEVFTDDPSSSPAGHKVRARLRSGQYFGEVTSLSLAPQRTASVRTVTSVECLVIRGDVIDELWRRCPLDLRKEVETTAKQRLKDNADFGNFDVPMSNSSPSGSPLATEQIEATNQAPGRDDLPPSPVEFSSVAYQNPARLSLASPEPFDPDPFYNTERSTRRPGTSRRGSLANLPAEGSPLAQSSTEDESGASETKFMSMIVDSRPKPSRPRLGSNQPDLSGKGIFSDAILTQIFQHLDVYHLMRCRLVSHHWSRLLIKSPDLLNDLNLSVYNRYITDRVLSQIIAPFVGQRPRSINISNCFHITDEGFSELVAKCGENVTHWRMKSVWDISPSAIVQMANKSQYLVSVDFSNCRKVSDNLLSRVVGWIVRRPSQQQSPTLAHPYQPDVTVVGCPRLTSLTLSYCKHVSDRFMQHIAYHAADRLERMNLTRCTTISDMGFRHWSERSFPRLKHLTLADCTYLSDIAISYLTQAARNLEELDLSFCCALSDASVDRISATLPHLRVLNLAFCGSAVSDASMAGIGHGLKRLRELSVRGCVRVTRIGVEAVVSGCRELEVFDVSQCRNLYLGQHFLGGRVKFYTVADGRWRVND